VRVRTLALPGLIIGEGVRFLPHWFPIVLIATTLVAVVLGLIVYATRN
jgi:hypothetical protein